MRGLSRTRRILLVLALSAGSWMVARAQVRPPKDPFAERTDIATQTVSAIDSRVSDIEVLRAQAARDGQAVRLSCIDEKLQRSKSNQSAAKVVMDGWSLGQNNPPYVQRSLDRLMLLQVYAMVYSEEARACSDAQQIGQSLEVKVDKNMPAGDSGSGNKPGGFGGNPDHDNPNRPLNFERPPLASPY